MRRRRARSGTPPDWPPTLRHLVHAASLECPSGHAETLRELSTLALRKVPSRGIFDPAARGEHELFSDIEAVARAHLELMRARAAWTRALDAAGLDLDRRDDIEGAASQVQAVYDTAYFYAGLAFGLAFGAIHHSA